MGWSFAPLPCSLPSTEVKKDGSWRVEVSGWVSGKDGLSGWVKMGENGRWMEMWGG